MPNIGMPELLVILVIAFLIFGAKRLPEIAKSIGKDESLVDIKGIYNQYGQKKAKIVCYAYDNKDVLKKIKIEGKKAKEKAGKAEKQHEGAEAKEEKAETKEAKQEKKEDKKSEHKVKETEAEKKQ